MPLSKPSPGLPAEPGVSPSFLAYGRLRSVARQDDGIVGKRQQLGANALYQLLVATAGEVGSSYPIIEEGIPAEDHSVPHQRDTARGVPRGMEHGEAKLSQLYDIAIVQQTVRLRRALGAA